MPSRSGVGELQETVLRVPKTSIGFWLHRLQAQGVERTERFGKSILTFRNPDGMRLVLVGLPGIEGEPAWSAPDISAEAAIRSVHGVSLLLDTTVATGVILSDVPGFVEAGREGDTVRYRVNGAGPGGIVDLHGIGGFLPARQGRGSVHHLACLVADDAAEFAMVEKLVSKHGIRTTEQMDLGALPGLNMDYRRSFNLAPSAAPLGS